MFCDIGVKVNGLPRQVQTCSDGYSRGQTQQTLVWLVISFFTLGRFPMTLYDSVIFWGLGSNQSEQLVILSTNKVWVICRQSDPAIEIQLTFRVGSHQDLTTMLDHSFRLNQPKSAGSCYFLSRERFSRCRAARLAGGNIDVSTH